MRIGRNDNKPPEYVLECDGLRVRLVPYRAQSCELSKQMHIGAAYLWRAFHMARALEGQDAGYLSVASYRFKGHGHVEHE